MHDLAPALLGLVFLLPACDGGSETGTDSEGMSGSTSGGSESDSDGESSGGSASASGTSAGSTSGSSTSEGSTSGGSSSEGSTSAGTSSGGESTGGASSSGGTTGGDAALPDGFEDMLSADGCGDMVVYGRTPADDIALVMRIDGGLVDAAATSGDAYDGTHDVSEFDTFEVLVGTMVSFPVCNDIATDDTVIDQTWLATDGSVHITIDPVADAPPFGVLGHATVELSGVEVTYDGVTETLDDVVFEDVAVGWLPG